MPRQPNWATVKERLNGVMNELARLQRAVDEELLAADQPEMVSIPADELARLRGETATTTDDASAKAAKQSVALGNADASTRAQAVKADESKK